MKKLILSATALTFLASSVAAGVPVTTAAPAVDATLAKLVQYRDREDRDDRIYTRGERLPRPLRDNSYVYYDWRQSNLPRPPQGFRWMLIGDQYILASIANGQIRDVRFTEAYQERMARREDRAERREERAERREDRREDRREARREYSRAEREQQWRARYARHYQLNDDAFYRECRNRPDPAGALVGAVIGGLLGNAAGNRRNQTETTIMGVVAGGAIGAALTNKLDCNDRSYAYKTYTTGFNAGRANAFYDWQNPQTGTRGRLHVLDYYEDEDNFHCSVYSQTIWINGRPEEARGRACQQPDGAWAIID